MVKKDISIDTIAAGAAELISVASITNPLTAVAGVTAVALFSGIAKNMLENRQEFVEQIANDLTDSKTLNSIKKIQEDQFLDDLSYSLERILKQRTLPKRILMKNIFLGYINEERKSSFPLEKIYRITEELSFADIIFLRNVFSATEIKARYPIPYVDVDIMDNHAVPKSDQNKMLILAHQENGQDVQSKVNLINAGLVVEERKGVGTWGGGEGTPQIYITALGKYFKNYLLNVDL